MEIACVEFAETYLCRYTTGPRIWPCQIFACTIFLLGGPVSVKCARISRHCVFQMFCSWGLEQNTWTYLHFYFMPQGKAIEFLVKTNLDFRVELMMNTCDSFKKHLIECNVTSKKTLPTIWPSLDAIGWKHCTGYIICGTRTKCRYSWRSLVWSFPRNASQVFKRNGARKVCHNHSLLWDRFPCLMQ